MIGGGMAAFSETDQNENEESRPPDKKCAHEPMAELEDVVDLVAVLGRVRWLPEKLVDEREAIHTFPNLLRSVPDVARAASGHDAKCES